MERVTRHLYAADDWGVGELWLREGGLLHHVLAGDDPSLAAVATDRRSGRAARVAAAAAGARPIAGDHARADAPGHAPVHSPLRIPSHGVSDAPSHAPGGAARPPRVTLPPQVSQDRAGFVPGGTDHDRVAAALAERFRAHLGGVRVDYDDVEVELDHVTPFDQALAEALRGVPWGEVVTYGELAALAGSPRAARAAGSFCARGGLSLVLPYHRVIAASGIGGYGPDGVPTKRRLLELEGVRL